MSPCGDRIRPRWVTTPLPVGTISLPRVVDAALPSVPWPRLITKLSPAASAACPLAVTMEPALSTSRPSNST
ncbi:hypothetical protein G6F53_014326 [Rhizopus delemar]|nr:hypothetical protein G6F53_014326 [Rhizopus delemar]